MFEVLEFAGEQLNVEVHELVYQLLLLGEQRRPIFPLCALLRSSAEAVFGLGDYLLRGDFLGHVEGDWGRVGAAAEAEVEH